MGPAHIDGTAPSARPPPQRTVLYYEHQLQTAQPTQQLHDPSWQPTARTARSVRSHRTIKTHRSQAASVTSAMPSHRRFVAGESFFNYEAFGSLRPEFMPVQLFSTAFLGLAVNALAAGFTFTLLKFAFRQLLGEFLRVQDESFVTSIKYLLEWPGSFAIFIGFLSDCRPIEGRRRKPYMILGWVLACVLMLMVATIDFTLARSWEVLDVDTTELIVASNTAIVGRVTKYGGVLLALTILTALMLQLMYISSLSMTVEFAQRETLQDRGKLQAMYFVLYYLTAALAQGVATLFVLPDEHGHVRSTLSLGSTALILAIACLVPVPFLVLYLDEPAVAGTTVHFSVRRRVHELWRFCHQNVVNRTLFFLVGHFFLIGLYNGNAREALAKWCQITPAKQPAVTAADFSGYCLALAFWMRFMVNWSWRRVAGVGSVAYIVLYTFYTAMITYNVSRGYWFYTVMLSLLDMPRAWIKLYAVVLSTEIADNGREGVTLGLVFALQTMVGVTAHMVSAKMGKWLPFHVSMDDVMVDDANTRARVFTGAIVMFAVNALSLVIVLVIPEQKLDAQQLRAFGGYNRYASYTIAVVFTVLFTANFALNMAALT